METQYDNRILLQNKDSLRQFSPSWNYATLTKMCDRCCKF